MLAAIFGAEPIERRDVLLERSTRAFHDAVQLFGRSQRVGAIEDLATVERLLDRTNALPSRLLIICRTVLQTYAPAWADNR